MPKTDVSAAPERPSLTKIVATLGPATDAPGAVRRLAEAGASVFRLNFSHGVFADHQRRFRMVREASEALGAPLAVLGDLCGPKIRIGAIPHPHGIELHEGKDVLLVAPGAGVESHAGDAPVLACSYARIAEDVLPGHRVLINDGAVRTLAVERDMVTLSAGARVPALRCRVTTGGMVTSGKGVNLPDTDVSIPAITDFDEQCVRWAVEHDLDFLALSFVQRAADVAGLKLLLGGCAIPVVAKIEKPRAVEHIDEILGVADAIMVARGDLGVELDVARVPLAQKRLIARAHDYGRACIVATQMLETMIEKAGPTRAEASDVANAVLDGADALMLSGETAVGRRPALAVETLRRIALVVEDDMRSEAGDHRAPEKFIEAQDVPAAIAHGARTMAEDVNASLIVVWSEGGGTASRLSQNEFHVPVLAFSSDARAVRRMTLLRGVVPVHCPTLPKHRSEFARLADEFALAHRWVRPGQRMVLVGGKPFGVVGTANTVAIRTAGQMREGGEE